MHLSQTINIFLSFIFYIVLQITKITYTRTSPKTKNSTTDEHAKEITRVIPFDNQTTEITITTLHIKTLFTIVH